MDSVEASLFPFLSIGCACVRACADRDDDEAEAATATAADPEEEDAATGASPAPPPGVSGAPPALGSRIHPTWFSTGGWALCLVLRLRGWSADTVAGGSFVTG